MREQAFDQIYSLHCITSLYVIIIHYRYYYNFCSPSLFQEN